MDRIVFFGAVGATARHGGRVVVARSALVATRSDAGSESETGDHKGRPYETFPAGLGGRR